MTTPPAAPGIPSRPHAALELWRTRLLDLSRRNRALNYRPSPVAAVTVVDEHPAEVFRHLWLDGRAMRFRPTLPSARGAPGDGAGDGESPNETDDVPEDRAADFAPYDPEALDERHRDDVLQCLATPEALDRALRRLEEQARASLDEQGVTTLFLALGMLHYTEAAASREVRRAPLVLLPVALARRSARAGYTVACTDEDPVVNPALAEQLRRWGVPPLPELPAGDAATPAAVREFFARCAEVAAERGRAGWDGWAVRTEIALALFSFQKLVMFKDLEAHADAFAAHPVLGRLVAREAPAGAYVTGLPDDVRALDLDAGFAPEATAQVVDADASQLRAIAAVSRGHDLVIEGPPGTGKSQTITNLIAQALADGKTVLFVAEKRAALQVVHDRLVRAGLGEFCLELHGVKANKRAVMQALRGALDASLRAEPPARETARLPALRAELTAYARAAHAPAGALGLSPYAALGALGAVADAPRVPLDPAAADAVTAEALAEAEQRLGELAAAAAPLGDPRAHPWRDSARTLYTPGAVDEAAARLDAAVRALEAVVPLAAAAGGTPGEAAALVARVRRLDAERRALERKFTAAAFAGPHAADADYVESKAGGVAGLLAGLFDGRYRAIRRRWESLRAAGYAPDGLGAQARDLRAVDRYLDARAALDAEAGPAAAQARALEPAAAAAADAWAALAAHVEWPAGYLADAPYADALARARAMRDTLGAAPAWGAFALAGRRAAASAAAPVAAWMLTGTAQGGADPRPAYGDLARAVRRAVLERLLECAVAGRPALRDFAGAAHEQRAAEFRRLDRLVLDENRGALVARLREATQARLREPAARAGLPVLQREMARQRGHAPLRRTLQQAEAAVRAVKPCFLMSPLTVAQYLAAGGAGEGPAWDLVIFDEASQLPTEDAVGAIARGRQLVVVGDPKQLPPTNFFAAAGGALADVPVGEDGMPVIEDTESVLEECMGAGLAVTRLRWHYRSAHESLIAFSNASFYDGDLYTFPSVEAAPGELGLTFEHVPDGVYEGKGLNLAEARRVADAVVAHARARPHESLGVGTFNMRQQLAVLDELELRRRQDPSLEGFFGRSQAEPFFVKNLENVQGDERDVMLLSVTYGRAADGRLRHNFGPINGENGWRRLNVLTTRARRRMRVFSSMRGDDINPAAAGARGALLLREFLRFAETGRLEGVVASLQAAAGSPFEAEVGAELARRGVRVVPQVGVSGYRIDLGVLDADVEGRFVCGIECDGVAYHSSETARDRDRLRQQVLEGRGWTILRVWSTDWFKDRAGQLARLLAGVEAAQRAARDRAAGDRAATERAATEGAAPAAAPAPVPNDGPPPAAYARPEAPPYRLADVAGRRSGEFLDAPHAEVAAALAAVVDAEGPVHADDAAARVAGAWGVRRVGSRIAARVAAAADAAVRAGRVARRGDFLWPPALAADGAAVPVRSRAGLRAPGERVPPEEVDAAVRLVLAAAPAGLPRDELFAEVRQVLGVGRAGLAATFERVLDAALAAGAVGEGSGGVALRGGGG